ncbi:MAG: hypothetical protein H0W89_07440 [Candidatus Levybacteria bacterium]|nr:hypothetical protein [Candidatus Levybacteria bacterium]
MGGLVAATAVAGGGGVALGTWISSPRPEAGTPNVSEPETTEKLRTGMTLPSFNRGELGSEDGKNALREIAELGVDTVALVPYGYQKGLNATEIYEDPQYSASDEEVEETIRRAKGEHGLRVVLKPHIDPPSGLWRGDIGKDFGPKERAAWFKSYTGFLLPYAEMAERTGVELFSVGVELKTMSPFEEGWRGVVEAVGGVYEGELTYAANHDEEVSWWELVDKVGVDEYTQRPSDDAGLAASWERTNRKYAALAEQTGKKIVLTEFGLTSAPGALTRPNEYGFSSVSDQDEQARGYRAALEALPRTGTVEEVVLWSWDLRKLNPETDTHFSPRGKKAGEVLRQFNMSR